MATINFTVEDHNIRVDNLIELAQASNNFDTCAFSFDSVWDGFVLYAVMYQNPKNVFKLPLDAENTRKIPQEVLQKDGWVYIGARGEKEDTDETIVTSMVVKLPVRKGAVNGNETGQEMLDQSQYEYLLGKVNELNEKCESLTKELENDFSQLSEEIEYVKKSSNIVERNAVGTCKIQHGKCIRSYNTETLLPNIIDKTGEMVVEYTLPRMGVIRVPKTGVSYQSFMLLDDNGKRLYNLTETAISNTSDLFPVIEDEYYEFSVDYLFKLGHLYPNPKTILFGFVDNGNAYIKEYNCYDENDVSFIDLSVYAKKDDVINNFEIVTPTDFICTAGLPFNIHIDQILKGANKNDVEYLQEVGNNYGDFYKNEFYANNSPLNGNKTFFLKMRGKYPDKQFAMNFIRASVPTIEKTLNVVFIGDSMTYHRHYIYHLMQKFTDTSITFNSIGTLSGGSHGATIRCEGRYGWSAYNYCHDTIYGDFTNAFLDSEGNFNFSNWVEVNQMESVNCACICLGTNDATNYTSEQMIESMNMMLSSIRDYSPTIPVLFWLPPTRALSEASKIYYINKDNALTAHQNIISNFCGRTSENVYIVPVYFYVDPYNDYDFKTVDLDGHGLTVAKIANDAVHPNADAGHLHIADAFYSAFCYLLVKNIV